MLHVLYRKKGSAHAQTPSYQNEGRKGAEETERPSDLAFNIRALRLQVTNWAYGWGPESMWEKTFNDQLGTAQEKGRAAVDRFFNDCDGHAQEGREILRDLKFVAEVSCNSTPDEIRDLFLQGYEMVMAVASEVKFFEVKLDEYAPAVPSTAMTDIRIYTTM